MSRNMKNLLYKIIKQVIHQYGVQNKRNLLLNVEILKFCSVERRASCFKNSL